VVSADGTGLRKVADRGGYRGVVQFLDVPDFHGGSSDVPAWSAEGTAIFHTATVGRNVELFRTSLDGHAQQMTHTPDNSLHYHPQPSPDGRWLVFGSKRDGVRQLYVMHLSDKSTRPITDLKRGHAAMWAYWQPAMAE
jgi:TolB protein